MTLEAVEDAYDVMGRFKTHLHQVLHVARGVEGLQEAFWRFEADFEETEEEGSGCENDALDRKSSQRSYFLLGSLCV